MTLACECVLKRIKMRSLDDGSDSIAVHLEPAMEMALALSEKPGRTVTPKPIEVAVTQIRDRQR